jgi:hypothetical protein
MSFSLYHQKQKPNQGHQRKWLYSIEEFGTNYYKINSNNHSLDNQGLISMILTVQSNKQIATTKNYSTVISHQSPSKTKDLQTYISETHQYLQTIYRTLPHHTAQEWCHLTYDYKSSRHHQYNTVALLLLKHNNRPKQQWH